MNDDAQESDRARPIQPYSMGEKGITNFGPIVIPADARDLPDAEPDDIELAEIEADASTTPAEDLIPADGVVEGPAEIADAAVLTLDTADATTEEANDDDQGKVPPA